MTGGKSPRNRGDYFEYQTRDDLISRGYIVGRSAGSRGSFDLVAMADGHKPMLVSCKVNGVITKAQRNAILAAAIKAGATAVLAHRPKPGHVSYARIVRERPKPGPDDEISQLDPAG